MKKEPAYPYQNLELANIKGEQWEDIPGLDGYYCVSNLGRTRRLAFEIIDSNGHVHRIKEKILMPDVTVQKNHSVNDLNYFLRTKIKRAGVVYNISLARLVFHLFVKNFDLSNHSLVVIAKDGNGKNIHPKNLKLVNISQKQLRIFERERLIRHLPDAYEEFVTQGLTKSTNPFCKQISQYTLEGKKIQTYPGTKVAAQVLGISEGGITSVLKGRQISSGGYVWRYGKEEKRVDMKTVREERILHYKHLVGQKLTQYSPEGKRIATFLTIGDAARATGIGSGDISTVLSGKRKSAGGFIWKKGWGKPEIDLSNYIFGEALKTQKKCKQVKQYSAEGKLLNTYPSIKEAETALGISSAYISKVLNKPKQAKGFFFKAKSK